MNFRTVTEKLLASFREQDVKYALIGGYAVGLWGVTRGTVDMDFLVLRDDLAKLGRIMQGLGFELRHHSENVSQYISPWGEVDFLHAFRTHSLQMLNRSVEKKIFAESVTVNLLLPEDLIGLKVQAIANNEERRNLDMYDIEELMRLHGRTMDWGLLEEYFSIFDMHGLYAKLKGKYHDAD
jgi:hypothetical protein